MTGENVFVAGNCKELAEGRSVTVDATMYTVDELLHLASCAETSTHPVSLTISKSAGLTDTDKTKIRAGTPTKNRVRFQ